MLLLLLGDLSDGGRSRGRSHRTRLCPRSRQLDAGELNRSGGSGSGGGGSGGGGGGSSGGGLLILSSFTSILALLNQLLDLRPQQLGQRLDILLLQHATLILQEQEPQQQQQQQSENELRNREMNEQKIGNAARTIP